VIGGEAERQRFKGIWVEEMQRNRNLAVGVAQCAQLLGFREALEALGSANGEHQMHW
jgi:hypothetical protein